MAVGGFAALLITPAFALSYFSAYAVPGESPSPWLAALQDPLVGAGLLVPGSTTGKQADCSRRCRLGTRTYSGTSPAGES